MNIAVDPDVFRNYQKDYYSTFYLIQQDKNYYRFVLSDEIKEIYNEFYKARKDYFSTPKRFALAIVGELLNGTTFKKMTVKPENAPKGLCGEWQSCEIAKLNKHLLEIATSLSQSRTQNDLGPTVALLLDRNEAFNISCAIRKSVDGKRCGMMDDVLILSAGETESLKSQYIDLIHLINPQQQAKHFESICAHWLNNKFGGKTKFSFKVGDKDIDAAVFLEEGETTKIYFAECKLLRTKETNTQAPVEALTQLKKRIGLDWKEAVRRDARQSYIIPDAFVITNFYGDNLDNLRKTADSIGKQTEVNIHFIQVKMPNGWQDNITWDLPINRFEDIT